MDQTYLDSSKARRVGTYNAFGDLLKWSYFDTMTLATATTVTRLFTAGISGRTLADTNLTQGGQIPTGQIFSAFALKMIYTTGSLRGTAWLESFYSMLKNTTLEVIISNKSPVLQICLQEMLNLPLALAMEPTTAANNIPFSSIGKCTGVYPLGKYPIVLAENTNFEVRITHQVAAAAGLDGDTMKIIMDGELNRAS